MSSGWPPSPRQVKRGQFDRGDVSILIDGPIGQRVFSISEKPGCHFRFIMKLKMNCWLRFEKMLAQYPKAKVIWCHFAQIRYIERASRYSPAYIESLIKRFPESVFRTPLWQFRFDLSTRQPAAFTRRGSGWRFKYQMARSYRRLSKIAFVSFGPRRDRIASHR